jgi:N-acylglucosamine-6-phosphate 2-epimerase
VEHVKIDDLENGLIVSCQAHGDHQLRDMAIMAALAECAERGGAAGILDDGAEDVGETKGRNQLSATKKLVADR